MLLQTAPVESFVCCLDQVESLGVLFEPCQGGEKEVMKREHQHSLACDITGVGAGGAGSPITIPTVTQTGRTLISPAASLVFLF